MSSTPSAEVEMKKDIPSWIETEGRVSAEDKLKFGRMSQTDLYFLNSGEDSLGRGKSENMKDMWKQHGLTHVTRVARNKIGEEGRNQAMER